MARKRVGSGSAPVKKSTYRRRTARRAPEYKDKRQYESDVLDEAKQRRARRRRKKTIKGLRVL